LNQRWPTTFTTPSIFLSSLRNAEKRDLLDIKVDPKGLWCDTGKKEREALQACLKRRPRW